MRALGLGEDATAEQALAATDAACRRPWFRRGLLDAITSAGLSQDDTAKVAICAAAFERAAQAALIQARAIATDPALPGQEAEALALLAEGLDHAEIRGRLARKAEPAAVDGGGNVITLRGARGT